MLTFESFENLLFVLTRYKTLGVVFAEVPQIY